MILKRSKEVLLYRETSTLLLQGKQGILEEKELSMCFLFSFVSREVGQNDIRGGTSVWVQVSPPLIYLYDGGTTGPWDSLLLTCRSTLSQMESVITFL